ncbi:arad-like aldolase/epimerase [Mycena metata]|uniref:Arad-like aldolase/epimerase n=1 Tax=Mycena metata TaxID=1033252 RepID=A0AAD7DZL0_9AGAR|nr:arad-like aldolase/epimerase [Mycena metata]KAJ7728337.1 arad-like aldolase/epimerase [Mycena metata]
MAANGDMQTISSAFRGKPPGPPVFATKTEEREFIKFRLAQALRIFGNRGYDEGVAGHITVRDPIRPDCFWVNPFGLHFKLIQPSDLLLVDHSGNILDESGQKDGPFRLLNTAAFMIHSAIHAARPDVLCAAHSHSPYGKAFSALGKKLDPISQDACAFYDDHVLYEQYNGIVLDEVEGAAITAALGTHNKAAILQNHGLLVATGSIEATLHFYVAMERACQVQLLADTAAAALNKDGKTVHINSAQAKETSRIVGSGAAGWFSGCMEFMVLEREEGVKFQFSG